LNRKTSDDSVADCWDFHPAPKGLSSEEPKISHDVEISERFRWLYTGGDCGDQLDGEDGGSDNDHWFLEPGLDA
jgi:hypothetical protein